jgi:hypothetical protein
MLQMPSFTHCKRDFVRFTFSLICIPPPPPPLPFLSFFHRHSCRFFVDVLYLDKHTPRPSIKIRLRLAGQWRASR